MTCVYVGFARAGLHGTIAFICFLSVFYHGLGLSCQELACTPLLKPRVRRRVELYPGHATSGAAARLLFPLTFRPHECGLALAFTFAREATQSFSSRCLEGRRPAEPRQGQTTELAHPCYHACVEDG